MSSGTAAVWLRRLAPLVAMAAAVAVAFVIIRPGEDSPRTPSPTTSTAPEAFVLPRLAGGGAIRLIDFRGKPTVVNFFASWCTPCRGELPGFARVSSQLQGGASFIFVNSLETGDGLAMARELGISAMPVARDVGGSQGSGLHDAVAPSPSMPVTAFYGADGRRVFVRPGAMSEEELRAKLHELFSVGPG
ncbi:MAG: TlpA family protein disulfide reductase [Candidatus Dormibacteria bacterium]